MVLSIECIVVLSVRCTATIQQDNLPGAIRVDISNLNAVSEVGVSNPANRNRFFKTFYIQKFIEVSQ